MTTTSFSLILQQLEEFLAFCEALGLGAEATRGRFGIYRERIRDLTAEIGRLRSGEPQETVYKTLGADLQRHLVAISESLEVAGMLPLFRMSPSEVVTSRLKALLGGPELPSDEDAASNQARNIQFEVWLATSFSRAGVRVVLDEPDLRCRIGDATILIACKRLFSVKKLTKRINEASEQLRRALGTLPEPTSWGVVAISLSRLLTTTNKSETIANRAEGLARLASRIESLVEKRARWQQTREVQAILFQNASTFTNLRTNRIESGTFLTMYGDGPVAATLAETLEKAATESAT